MSVSGRLESQAAKALVRASFSGKGSLLVVGISGGPDSSALLHCLYRLSHRHGLRLHAAHLNHDFRGAEADHDAAFVQQLADRLGLPCSIDKQDPIAYQRARGISSFEQAAREMRYSFLSQVASATGAAAVALGHTTDDQAETVLMHILRGSGLHGLRGMVELVEWPWPQPEKGPLLFRPLLGVAKADTAAYCRELGQTYRQDSGNYMWRFTRNKVRLDLMPRLSRDYNPRVRDALLRLSRAAANEADFIEGELDRHWPTIAQEFDSAVRLNADEFSSLHPALQHHALRRAYAIVAGDARSLGEVHLENLQALMSRGPGSRALDLPRGVCARMDSGTLRIVRKGNSQTNPESAGEYSIDLPSMTGEAFETVLGGWRLRAQVVDSPGIQSIPVLPARGCSVVLNRDALGESATVRSRRPGDRFQPSGMTGTKKLQDYFVDAKVPREQRDHIPLLACDRGVAWVVGHRVAEWALARNGDVSVRVSISIVE